MPERSAQHQPDSDSRKNSQPEQQVDSQPSVPLQIKRGDLLSWQRVVGNQAVQRLVDANQFGAARASGLPPVRGVIQRDTIQERINEALDGWGADSQRIMELTAQATPAEKQAILNDAALIRRLADELNRSQMLQVLANLNAPLEMRLNAAMDGWGVDGQTIVRLTAGASEAEKQALLNDGAMMSRLAGELSRADMLQVLANVNAPLILRLNTAMDGWGVDRQTILSLTANATDAEKQAVLEDQALMSRLAGELSRADMLQVLANINAPLILRLNTAMDGWGVDRQTILQLTANATDDEKQAVLEDQALIGRLASELSRADMLQVLANVNAPLILRLNTAMNGWGADRQTILDLTANATPAEKQAVLADDALVERLSGELSRDDMLQVLANLDAPLNLRLLAAMRGWGADQEAIQSLLTSASPADREAALNDAELVARLQTELSTAAMLRIFTAAGVPFKRIIELALDPWGASLDEMRPTIEAASDADRETVWSDSTLMSNAATILGEQEYLNFVTALRMFQAGTTAEDNASHTSARDADDAIRAHLGSYVEGAVREGRQISGMVAVVDDDDWDRAGVAHYGSDVWNNGKRDSINGFVDAHDRVWIHRNRGNAGTMIHEAVHKYGADALINISQPLNEGVTEYFTRIVCAALTPPITGRGNYQPNYDTVVSLVALVGEDVVARAFFDGDTDGLESTFVGAKSQADWDNFVRHTRRNRWADAAALL